MVEKKSFTCNGCGIALKGYVRGYLGIMEDSFLVTFKVSTPMNRSVIGGQYFGGSGIKERIHLCVDCYNTKFKPLLKPDEDEGNIEQDEREEEDLEEEFGE